VCVCAWIWAHLKRTDEWHTLPTCASEQRKSEEREKKRTLSLVGLRRWRKTGRGGLSTTRPGPGGPFPCCTTAITHDTHTHMVDPEDGFAGEVSGTKRESSEQERPQPQGSERVGRPCFFFFLAAARQAPGRGRRPIPGVPVFGWSSAWPCPGGVW